LEILLQAAGMMPSLLLYVREVGSGVAQKLDGDGRSSCGRVPDLAIGCASRALSHSMLLAGLERTVSDTAATMQPAAIESAALDITFLSCFRRARRLAVLSVADGARSRWIPPSVDA